MFFSQALLWRKGPVATIWTAAYCFKKLKREQIAETDIASSVDQIIGDIEISYRILAHLLVGIVKIFSKKVEFLEEDCNKTLKTLTESFRAIYWTNPQKTKHVRKQTTHVPSTSSGGTHTGKELLEALRAHSDQVVISVPARFELDLFDLEIAEDCDAPDRHQLSSPCDNTLDGSESVFFRHKTYQMGSGCRMFSSTCFTPIQDVIPVEIMIDLDLDITDLYESTSSKREKAGLNPDDNVLGEHQESIHNLRTEDPIGVVESVEPSVGHHESPLKDINADGRHEPSAEQHQESIQNLHDQDPNGEAEAVEPSVACHESPLKDINVASEEKEPILKTMQIDELLKLTEVPTIDPGLFSPKPMVRTPAKRDISTNLRKRKISWCYDQEILLSNEVMRNAIHDPSDLVRERRKKSPRNCLEAWRVDRYSSVDQLFSEPLIPCTFSKVYAGASEYTPHKPNNHNTKLENPLNVPCVSSTDVGNVGASGFEQSKTHHIESKVEENETIEKSENISNMENSRSDKIRRRLFEPETPEREPNGRSTDISDWAHETSGVPSGVGSLPDGSTPRILTHTSSDTTLSSLDGELGSHDGDEDADQTKEGSVWSARTRYVAHHLHKKFSSLKRQHQENCLSLEQILEGKKRKTCARFFYETLMLKGRGMIDVKQESPYGDIQISVTPHLDEEFRDI